MVDQEMVGKDKGALKQEQYDADFVMLGKKSYLQELKDSAMTEYCSSLTLSELEGCSRYSLSSEKDSLILDMRKNGNVSSGLALRSDNSTITANESRIEHLRHHHELQEKNNAEKWRLGYEPEDDVQNMVKPRKRGKIKQSIFNSPRIQPLANQDPVQIEVPESVMPFVDQESDESRRNESFRRLSAKSYLEWTLTTVNIILEALATAFDQEASPSKPKYALIGLLMSVVAVSLCMGEFIYKAQEARVVFTRRGFGWWLSTPSDYEPFGTFADIFGLICATFQCIFSIIQYAYFSHHAENPLKISLLPLIFALCVAYSRYFSRDREPLPHRHNP